jgi:hypothetical protein
MLTSFRNSRFEGNRGAELGGAVFIAMPTSSPNTGFVRTVFSGCRLRNNTASLQGGAIYHDMPHAGASLELHRCTLLDNYAGEAGGGIWAVQGAANPPTNLEMNATDNGPTQYPRYSCSAVYTGAGGYAREWDYGTSTLFIDASIIGNNSAGDEAATDTVATGGGIFAQPLNITARNSNVTANQAAKGGAFSLGSGSAMLLLSGNTSLRGNFARTSGTAIYSHSAGDIALLDEARVDFHDDAAASGFAILSGGKLEYSRPPSVVLGCAGDKALLNNMSTEPVTFGEWKIDCSIVQSMDNGTRVEFENPTCKQMQRGNSPLTTYQCFGLPLQPAMLSTSGTVSCSVCNPPSPPSPDSRIYECVLGECVVNLNTTAGAKKTVCESICTAPSPPPTPAPIRYRCAGGQCVVSATGGGSKAACESVCVAPTPPPTPLPTYKCTKGRCVATSAGGVTKKLCESICTPPAPSSAATGLLETLSAVETE